MPGGTRSPVFPVFLGASGIQGKLKLDKFQYIDLFPCMGKHDDFIKISYCIFKLHKPSVKFFYEKYLCKGSGQFKDKE